MRKPMNQIGVISLAVMSALLIAGCQKESAAPVATEQQAATGLGAEVTTKSGRISGTAVQENGQQLLVFRGIPYAAPPVGDLRWKAPQPVQPWSDVRPATEWGNRCPQRESDGFGKIDEDCLNLNVTTSAKSADAKLPVMVFFHGGGLTTGTANSSVYNATALPKQGVVLVTVNSRLGPIGYMAHPALTAESDKKASGNYGTLDLIASLKWIQDNIAAFGGDPDNVLIFGESGGGTKTLSVLSSPLAEGLFDKAIIQSGSALISPERVTTLEAGEARGEKIVAKLGLDKEKNPVAAMRAASWQDIIAAAAEKDVGYMANLTVDGHVLPLSVHETFKQGKQHDVPLIVGANAGERGELLETVPMLANFHSKTANANTYVYNFAHVPAGWKTEGCPAFHGIEIPYVFGAIPDGLTVPTILYLASRGGCKSDKPGAGQPDHALAANMTRMWATFAKTGNPSVEGVATWPAYEEENGQYLNIDQTIEVKKGIKDAYVEPPRPVAGG